MVGTRPTLIEESRAFRVVLIDAIVRWIAKRLVEAIAALILDFARSMTQ